MFVGYRDLNIAKSIQERERKNEIEINHFIVSMNSILIER